MQKRFFDEGHSAHAREQDETDPIETTFELNDTLYARANIPPTEEVYIWLGVRRRVLERTKSCQADRRAIGQRHVVVPHRRSPGAVDLETHSRQDESVEL